jgi:hypothetical protein
MTIGHNTAFTLWVASFTTENAPLPRSFDSEYDSLKVFFLGCICAAAKKVRIRFHYSDWILKVGCAKNHDCIHRMKRLTHGCCMSYGIVGRIRPVLPLYAADSLFVDTTLALGEVGAGSPVLDFIFVDPFPITVSKTINIAMYPL